MVNWRARRCATLFLLTVLIPGWEGFRPELALAGTGKTGQRVCRKIVLEGEVAEKQEWGAAIGEGWEFRLMPIVGTPGKMSPAAGQGYSGWDLVVDREQSGGYPDALLLATPPYGSVNEREVGTTYGLRAQDAIAWSPRRFHFLTTLAEWQRARDLYAVVMRGAGQRDAAGGAAARELLAMIGGTSIGGTANGGSSTGGSGDLGRGEFAVLDARLVAGVADPPAYAQPWASHLALVPHTLEQSGVGGAQQPLGELKWIRFHVTLVLPARWKLPAGMRRSETNCAE